MVPGVLVDKTKGDNAMLPMNSNRAISRYSTVGWRLPATAVLTLALVAGAAGLRPQEADAMTPYCKRLMSTVFFFARQASYERTVTGDLEQADEYSQMLEDASAEFSQNCT